MAPKPYAIRLPGSFGRTYSGLPPELGSIPVTIPVIGFSGLKPLGFRFRSLDVAPSTPGCSGTVAVVPSISSCRP